MEIYVRIKAIGKCRDILSPVLYTIPDNIGSLHELLAAVVENEVNRFNNKETELQLIPYLSEQELEGKNAAGKVTFGTIYSDKKADAEKAVENVIQCWKDGLVRVFMNEEELTELAAPLTISVGTVFTFIRLTFLAGSIW